MSLGFFVSTASEVGYSQGMITDQPRFTVTTEGRNELDLRGLCDRLVNGLWIPDHLTADQAAEYAADYFRRTVLGELELLNVTTTEVCQ